MPTTLCRTVKQYTIHRILRQRYSNTIIASCPPSSDENALIALWNLAGAIKQEYFVFNVLIALLGCGIGECLLMACLGHIGSLKLKQESN